MLTPHNPSKNLHAPIRASVARPEDLADVHITVVPPANGTNRPAARATPSGRAAAINARPPG